MKKAEERPAPAVCNEVTHLLALDPADWTWATWRERKPLTRPEPEPTPFDLNACLEKLATIQVRQGFWGWSDVKLPALPSREEAHFWLAAMAKATRITTPPELAETMAGLTFDGTCSFADVKQSLLGYSSFEDHQLAPLVGRLLAPREMIALFCDTDLIQRHYGWTVEAFLIWIDRWIIPYLDAEELRHLRDRLRPEVAVTNFPAEFDAYWQQAPAAFYLAPRLGLHDEMLALVETWPDDAVDTGNELATRIVFGLGSAQLVEEHARRLNLCLCRPQEIRGWLAHTELNALDIIRDGILRFSERDGVERKRAEQCLKEFCRLVRAPEAGPHLLELRLRCRTPIAAREWLDEQVGNAVAGLVPLAAGRGKLAEAAVEYLRETKRKGLAALIEERLKQAPQEIADKVRRGVFVDVETHQEPLTDQTTPDWLRRATEAAGETRTNKMPEWARPTALPPLPVGGRRLNDEQVLAVLRSLKQSSLAEPLPLLQTLKEHVDPTARDAFAWRLFELWQAEGMPPKEKWALLAVGHLGGDRSALELTPLIRAWPGQSQHQRAVLGLECLKAIGTDTALMQLHGIAQKLRFKGLQTKAQLFMEGIAVERGLSRTQLEDRIVPDLDLDERGSKVFDLGPRQFRLVLGPDLTPQVVGGDGKARADLPKPGAKDDADKANAAVAEWKLLKKQLREVVKVQAARLERAMVIGRRWPVNEFETLLLRHPLMTNLVRRLAWGGYDAKGNLIRSFRVTGEGEFADEHDAVCPLDGVAKVGVVHPLHLSEEQRSKWGEVFSDYEIIAPFRQLGRPVYGPEPGEGTEITRFSHLKIPSLSVAGTLEKFGWERGELQDHGSFHEHTKYFPNADVTAIVQHEPGLHPGGFQYAEEQTLTRCIFVAGDWGKPLELAQVDPMAVSEVLADLTDLASRGK